MDKTEQLEENKIEVSVPLSLIKEVCRYCENQGVWDKLAGYNDFYYKLKYIINQTNFPNVRTTLKEDIETLAELKRRIIENEED